MLPIDCASSYIYNVARPDINRCLGQKTRETATTRKLVVTVAYKGSGKKARIQGTGGKRSSYGIGGPGSLNKSIQNIGSNPPKKSKGQSGSGGNSRKVHDTKGKNTQGRNRGWF